MGIHRGPKIVTNGLVFGYDTDDNCRFYNGEPTVNVATDAPLHGGWPNTCTLIDSSTKTFDLTVSTVPWGDYTDAWMSFLYDVSSYVGQLVTVSFVVESVKLDKCKLGWIMVGQATNADYFMPDHAAYKYYTVLETPQKISWTGTIISDGVVGLTMWMGESNFGTMTVRISNVQVELKSHPTQFVNTSRSSSPTINLLDNPLTMPSSSWVARENVEVTEGQTDPFGLNNALKIHPLSGSDSYFGIRGAGSLIGGSVSTSVWLKASKACVLKINTGSRENYVVEYDAYLTTNWQLITFSGNLTGTPYHRFHLGGWGTWTDTSFDVYIAYPQVEQKSQPTPFVNGSRVIGDSLIDLTKNHSIDLSKISFDGTSHPYFYSNGLDYINVPHNSNLSLTSQGTLSVWMYPYTLAQKNYAGLIAKNVGGSDGTLSYNLSCRFGTIHGEFHNQTTNNSISIPFPTEIKWYNVTFTWDSSYLRLYIDGVSVATPVAQTINAEVLSTDVTIGGRTFKGAGGIDEYFNGKIPVVYIYNRALSETEVVQNYNAKKGKFEIENLINEGLTHHYDCGNKNSLVSGSTTWYDIKGTIQGTLQNNPTFSEINGGFLTFDGTNDSVILWSSIELGNATIPWIVTSWVKTTTTVNDIGQGPILTNSSGGPVASMMGVNGGKIVYWIYHSGWYKYSGNAIVNDGKWHQLTWVNNSNQTMDMYVDGVFDANVPNSSCGQNPVNDIGGSWAGYFDGSIGSVKIFQNRSLISDDVLYLYNNEKKRFGL